MNIRPPSVAGLFYPDDPATLQRRVDELLSASADPPRGTARIVVSPHAGYPYSGRVAAGALRALAASNPRTVILLGPSHVEYFSYSAVFDGDGYETPLGSIPIDGDTARRITAGRRTVRLSSSGHAHHGARGEHSLEVQLPLLQRLLPALHIVPIVMGEQRWEHCRELGDAIASVIDDDIAVVVSSDLSHFHDHERAEILDGTFAATLETMDARELHDATRDGRCEACGAGPVVAALRASESLAGRRVEILERTNSGAVTGDRTSVVGYLSAAVTVPQEPA